MQKKHDTIAPFPTPIGTVDPRGVGLNFHEYNQYYHGDEVKCCKCKVEDKQHVGSEAKPLPDICGPFSTINASISFTCHDVSLESVM